MAVQKSIELIGTGPSIEEAVTEAMDRASLTLEAIDYFEVVQVSGVLAEHGVTYRVQLRVWFTLLERMHG